MKASEFDFAAAQKAHGKWLEREYPGKKVFYDGPEDPLHQWSALVQADLEAELAAMTPEQRQQAAEEARAALSQEAHKLDRAA